MLLRCLLLGTCIALWPTTRAHASPLFELLGANFGSGGFNARATGASAASAYFNPALLPSASRSFELSTFVLNDAIHITLGSRDPAVNVPDAALNNFNDGDRSIGTLPSLPTSWLESGCANEGGMCVSDQAPRPRQAAGSSGNTRVYQAMGLVSHLWERYLTLGFYTLVPLSNYVDGHAFFADEREQYFSNSLHPELYSDRLTSLSMALGLGSQIHERVSVGLGFSLSLANGATAGTYIGDSSRLNDTLQLSTNIGVSVDIAPHLALQVTPIDALQLSATVHAPRRMETTTINNTLLANGDAQRVVRRSVQAWQPWIFALGGTYALYTDDTHALSATATATYQLWSGYHDRQGARPLINYEWANTISGALGLRYAHREALVVALDGTYQPTPVPLQSGRTNYVDNDRVGFNAGVTYELPIKLHNWNATLRLGAQAQLHLLLERTQNKLDPTSPALANNYYPQLVHDEWSDRAVNSRGNPIPEAAGLQTNNPGWPAFASSGTLLGAGLSAALLY